MNINKETRIIFCCLFLAGIMTLCFSLLYSPTWAYYFAQSLSADGKCESCDFDHFVMFRHVLFLTSILFIASSIIFLIFRSHIISTFQKIKQRKKNIFLFLFLVGIFLRLILFVSSSTIAYDDHSYKIFYIIEEKTLPLPHECWECFHPHAYYILSSIIIQIIQPFATLFIQLKTLQLLSLILSIITMYLIWRILLMLFSSLKLQLLGFSLAVFLPRNIYMSVTLSNDVMSYFFLTLFYYLLLLYSKEKNKAKEAKLFIGVCLVSLLSVLTKLSLLWVPVFFIIYLLLFEKSTYKKAISLIFYIALIIIIVGPFLYNNHVHYETLFVSPEMFFDYKGKQYFEGVASFTTFKLFELLKHPIIHITTETSFFTVLYADFWYDFTPIYVLSNSINYVFAPFIYIFALFPTLLILYGLFNSIIFVNKKIDFILTGGFLFNLGFIISYMINTTVYPMKSMYIIGSLVCLCYYFGVGWRKLFVGKFKFKLQKFLFWMIGLLYFIITMHIIFLSLFLLL